MNFNQIVRYENQYFKKYHCFRHWPLIGWGFLAGSEDTDTGLIMAIIVCICLLIAGEIMFGIEFKQKREGIMLKTSAGGWAFCVLVMNMAFLGFAANLTVVFIANGISLLLFLLLANSIYKV